MNTHELAWAAGLFDGEGCLTSRKINHSDSWTLHLDIAQSGDVRVLNRFVRAVGVGSVRGPYRQKSLKDHHKSAYKYQLYSFELVQAVIAMLWKYMSEPKREQAHAALTAYHAGCTTGPRWEGTKV